MTTSDPRREVTAAFNRIAPGYDVPALRFFPFAADRLAARLNPKRAAKVLDVATGTGAVALALAQGVGDAGRIMAIDLSEDMLDRLQEKIDKFGIRNIDLHVMDAASLEFRREVFDNVVCSFGIFYLPDMFAGLKEWMRVTKPGGRVMFTVFGKQAFQPMMELFDKQLECFGVASPDSGASSFAARLFNPDDCRALLKRAGLEDIDVTTEQLGYHLKDEQEWWEVLSNSGMRYRVEGIPLEQRESFREEHLAEARPLVGDRGLWLNVEAHFAGGTKA